MKLNIPERFTGKLYVHMWSDPSSVLYGRMGFTVSDPSDWDGHTLLATVDVDVALDGSGTLDKQVDDLRRSKQKIIDEATEKASQIDEAIESLLAIEYKEPEA